MFWGDEPTHEQEPTEYRQNGVYFIFNTEGKVLVTQSPKEAKRNLWSVPQGGLKRESLDQNLRRELWEELRMSPDGIQNIFTEIAPIFRQEFSPERIKEEIAEGRNIRGKDYHSSTARWTGTDRLTPDPKEIYRYEFVTLKEALRRFSRNKGKVEMLAVGLEKAVEAQSR